MTARPIDVVKATYAAFGRGDGAAILALLDPATVWTVHAPAAHPYGGEFRGVEGVARLLGAIAANVDVLAFAPVAFTSEGDRVVVEGGETIRAKATGRTLAHRWVHVFEVRGGKIARFEEWFDSAAATDLFRR